MADRSIGKIFAEIDLSKDPVDRKLDSIKRDAGVVVLDVEKNFATLGIKSARHFDLMRAKIENAYQGIRNGAKSTADDILRAEKAMHAELARINEEQFGRRLSLLQTLRQHWLAASAAIAASMLVVRKAWDLAGTAADFQERVAALDALGRKAGMTGQQIVAAMKSASRGLLSLSEAADLAASALNLNLSAQQMVEFTRVAEALTDVIGGTIPEAFNRLTVAAASGRTQTLAQMGILVDLDKVYEEHAQRLGLTAKQLSEEERQRARLNAILEAAKGKVDALGEAVDTNRDKMDRALNIIKDMSLWVGEQLAGAFVSLIDVIAASNKKLEEQKKLLGEVTASFDAYTAGLQKIETPTTPPAHVAAILPDVRESLRLPPRVAALAPKPPGTPDAKKDAKERTDPYLQAFEAQQRIMLEAQEFANQFYRDQYKQAEDAAKAEADLQQRLTEQDIAAWATRVEEQMRLDAMAAEDRVRTQQMEAAERARIQEQITQDEIQAWVDRIEQEAQLDYDAQMEMVKRLQETAAARQQVLTSMQRDFESVFGAIANGFSTAMRGVQQGTQTMAEAFRNMAINILASIQDMIIRRGLMELAKMLSSTLGSAGGGWAGFAASIIQGLASYDTGGTVPGPVGRPQLAVVHGGEEVIPYGDRRGSTVINIDARGAQRGVSAEVMQAINLGMGRAVKVSVARVQDLSRRGRMRGLDK